MKVAFPPHFIISIYICMYSNLSNVSKNHFFIKFFQRNLSEILNKLIDNLTITYLHIITFDMTFLIFITFVTFVVTFVSDFQTPAIFFLVN